MNALTALDKKVIDLFTDGQAADSKKLTSDGKTLDGNWIGGRGIAVWQNGKIVLQDLGSRSAQIVQNYLRKVTPKNRLLEQKRVRETSMLDLVEQFARISVRSQSLSESTVVDAFEKMIGGSIRAGWTTVLGHEVKVIDLGEGDIGLRLAKPSEAKVLMAKLRGKDAMGGKALIKYDKEEGEINLFKLGTKLVEEKFAHSLTEVTAKAKEAKPKTAIGKALAASFDSVAKSDIVELENKIKEAGRPRSVDAALDFANKILQGHGIEAIRGDNQGGYYQDIVLLYVNQGDAYSLTLCYDVEKGKFLATSYDDWVERYGEERGVQ